jgi:hypothetical protein
MGDPPSIGVFVVIPKRSRARDGRFTSAVFASSAEYFSAGVASCASVGSWPSRNPKS